MFKCSSKKCRKPIETRGYCAECKREYRLAWSASHPGYFTEQRKKWELKNPDKVAEQREKRIARYHETKVLKEKKPALSHYERKKRYFEKYPIKAECMKIYKYAIRQGKLVRGPCSVCGVTEGVDGHHTDYTRPLDVVWLCKPHHREAHRTCE